MKLPSEDDVRHTVLNILDTNDLQKITLRVVMSMVCDHFSVPQAESLPLKPLVRTTINEYLENLILNDALNSTPPNRQQTNVPKEHLTDLQNSHNRHQHQQSPPENVDTLDVISIPDDPSGPDISSVPDPQSISEKHTSFVGDHPSTSVLPNSNHPLSPSLPSHSHPAPASKPVRLTGLERPVVLARPLATFIGQVVASRFQVCRFICTYVKDHNLQDPDDRRTVLCDDALKELFGVDSFSYFDLTRMTTDFIYKPEECNEDFQRLAQDCERTLIAEKIEKLAKAAESPSPDHAAVRPPRRRVSRVSRTPRPSRKSKKQKTEDGSSNEPETPRRSSAMFRPVLLSDALIAVVGETTLPRPQVLKKVWDYIHRNDLKDPNHSMQIMCDDKLKAIFDGLPTVTHRDIFKHLSAHMTNIEEA